MEKFILAVISELQSIQKVGGTVSHSAYVMTDDLEQMAEYFESMTVTETAGLLIELSA